MLSEKDLNDLVDDLESNQISEDANLSVYMGGLAIGHQGTDRWRSVFLTGIPNHDLQMFVIRRRPSTGHELEDTIDIRGHGITSIVPHGIQYWTSPEQNPGLSDLDQLANFSEFHGKDIGFEKPVGISLSRVEAMGGHGFTAMTADHIPGTPNYRFSRKGEQPPRYTKKKYLGTWLGINYKLSGGRSVDIKHRSENLHSSIVNEQSKVIILITNNCVGKSGACSEEMDFSYYYHDSGHAQKGVIGGTPFVMHVDPPTTASHAKSLTERTGDRIACNKMMIDDLGGLSSLFDLEG